MHGLVVLGASGEVLRPAILWNDQRTGAECARDRGADRARAPDRADRQPGSCRVHGAEAALAAPARARDLGPDPAGAAPEGLRPPSPDGGAGDRRRGRLRDAAPRRGCSALVGGGLRGARDPAGLAAAGPRVDRDRRRGRSGRRRARGRHRPARACSRSCSGRRASSSRCSRPTGPTSEARVHVFCHAVPGTWHAMGVMLSAAGSLAWLRELFGAPCGVLDEEAAGWPAGTEGLLFAPYLQGERTPYCGPGRARRLRRALASPRPRRARPRDARGRRLRAPGLARAPPRARRGCRGRAGLGRRLAQRALAEDRGLGARPAARAHRDRRGRRVRRRAARRGQGRRVRRTRPRRLRRCVRVTERVEPDPEWASGYEPWLRAVPSALSRTTTTGG